MADWMLGILDPPLYWTFNSTVLRCLLLIIFFQETCTKTTARRTLQVLQPAAASSSSTQTLLVGGSGTPLKVVTSKKPQSKTETVQSEPDKAESKCETRSVEVQTEVTAASGALDHAEAIAWMTTRKTFYRRRRRSPSNYKWPPSCFYHLKSWIFSLHFDWLWLFGRPSWILLFENRFEKILDLEWSVFGGRTEFFLKVRMYLSTIFVSKWDS